MTASALDRSIRLDLNVAGTANYSRVYGRADEQSSYTVPGSVDMMIGVITDHGFMLLEPKVPRHIRSAPRLEDIWQAHLRTQLSTVVVGPAHKKLRELRALPVDWDSYGAPRIHYHAIERARQLIDATASWALAYGDRVKPYAVVPVADGGVQVEWTGANQRIEVQISPSGTMSYLVVKESPGGPTYREVITAGLLDVLKSIHQVIAAER